MKSIFTKLLVKNKIIFVYMSQGLGNQLFHYCYILNLIQNAKQLKIKILFNRKPLSNIYEFQLEGLIKSENLILGVKYNNSFFYKIRIFISKFFKYFNKEKLIRIYREKDLFTYQENLLKLPNRSIVFGGYINSKYVDNVFSEAEPKIRAWLGCQQITKSMDKALLEDSVILHIRKSLENTWTRVRGVITEDFYREALDLISHKRGFNPKRIFCFTDDLGMAMNLIPNLKITYWFGPNDANNKQTLNIFANSKNFIGTNSTLSWWGAKLNSSLENSISILPYPWVQNSIHPDIGLKISKVTYLKIK
jgi:hypothetical protein